MAYAPMRLNLRLLNSLPNIDEIIKEDVSQRTTS